MCPMNGMRGFRSGGSASVTVGTISFVRTKATKRAPAAKTPRVFGLPLKSSIVTTAASADGCIAIDETKPPQKVYSSKKLDWDASSDASGWPALPFKQQRLSITFLLFRRICLRHLDLTAAADQ